MLSDEMKEKIAQRMADKVEQEFTDLFSNIPAKPKEYINNHNYITPEFLVCCKCGSKVTAGFMEFYSCEKCKSLTNNVEWKEFSVA